LREQVFSDAEAKARLEAILHPQIARAADQADQHAGPCTLVYDIPLVHPGSHWRRRSHRILVVDCPESVQIERVRHRSGLSTEAVQSIIDQQLQRPTRRGLADAILLNVDPSLQMLERNVESVWNHWHQTAWKSQAV
jgi:dephospho-CoA kinase